MHTQRMAVSVSVLALLTLAACGTEPGSGSGSGAGSGDRGDTVRSDVPVTGVRWNVDSVTVGGKKTEAPDGARLEIDPKGRATANFGCNHISAEARVEGDRITVGGPVSTQMACEEDIEAFEKAATRALTGELTAKLAGKKLTLTTGGGDTVALSEQPAADLVGTRWAVNTLLSGESATSVPADLPQERTPHLTFRENGTVEGNSGCNAFHAKATVKGDTITFGPVAGTRRMCPKAEMETERAVLAALDGKVTYTIKGQTLTLTAADDKGIAATAADAEAKGAPKTPRQHG
ncbi:META domain-containing protein [Streptomyces sp. C11-1]|uniref:META domain-containing protein n=2 Tax=Streptomyces TaxID=1883 RepID=A0ABY9VX00_9ACTN|nr:META domain-containing protein [Streptomyces durocortorensis]WNF28434.1 META domain-containing protein [Streptomyces durocortorensis]